MSDRDEGMCVNFQSLAGEKIKSVTGLHAESDEVIFELQSGNKFKLHHHQDCCESVYIEDVCGDTDDLIDAEIVYFEERSNQGEDSGDWESFTWTFYDIQTTKGCVNIRWLGTSNGYYSESVDAEWI